MKIPPRPIQIRKSWPMLTIASLERSPSIVMLTFIVNSKHVLKLAITSLFGP